MRGKLYAGASYIELWGKGRGLHNPSAWNELLEATRNDNDMRTWHMQMI